MVTDELLHLVKFDPNELRLAIAKCEQEADALAKKRNEVVELASLYRQILKTHGFDYVETNQHPVVSPTKPDATKVQDRRFRGMKITDAAALVVTEAGGKMHGKKIVEAVTAGGLKFGGKYPMDVLRGAMLRDERFERVPTERNTWRIKTGN